MQPLGLRIHGQQALTESDTDLTGIESTAKIMSDLKHGEDRG